MGTGSGSWRRRGPKTNRELLQRENERIPESAVKSGSRMRPLYPRREEAHPSPARSHYCGSAALFMSVRHRSSTRFLAALLCLCGALGHAKKDTKRYRHHSDYGYVPDEPKPIMMTSTPRTTTEPLPQIWPLGRIPFVDDPELVAHEDQAVALNNARMDLQIRTCVKFVPRKNERDYVYFTDLGLESECWNMFEQNHGHVAVNAGPSCLAPMRWPYKPKQVFSDCDVEYVNHLYNCPRRHRKHSPICPAGNTIMSLPQPLMPPTDLPIPLPPPTKKKTVRHKTRTTSSSIRIPNVEWETTSLPTPPAPPTPPPILPTPPSQIAGALPSPPEPALPVALTAAPTELELFTVTPAAELTSSSSTTSTTISTTPSSTTMTTTTTPAPPPPPPPETTIAEIPTTAEVPLTTTSSNSTSVGEAVVSVGPGTGAMSSFPTSEAAPAPVPDFVSVSTDLPEVSLEEAELIPVVQTTHIKAFAQRPSKNASNIRGRISHKDGLKSAKVKPPTLNFLTNKNFVMGSIGSAAALPGIGGAAPTLGMCGSPCNYTGGVTPLRRSYNDKMGVTNHYYTEDLNEQKQKILDGYLLQASMGFIGKTSQDPSCTCLRPLYRLYNEFLKDHLLTSREHEKEVAERILGYKYEKVLGFCTKEPGCGAYLPLYRFYNPIAKDHLYTIDEQEMLYYKGNPQHAYGFEYVECYVWKDQQVGTDCPLANLALNTAEMAQLALAGWNSSQDRPFL